MRKTRTRKKRDKTHHNNLLGMDSLTYSRCLKDEFLAISRETLKQAQEKGQRTMPVLFLEEKDIDKTKVKHIFKGHRKSFKGFLYGLKLYSWYDFIPNNKVIVL